MKKEIKKKNMQYSLGYRIIKKQIYIIAISILLLLATNISWLYYFIQLDKTNIQPSSTIVQSENHYNANVFKRVNIDQNSKKKKTSLKKVANV